MRWYPRIEDFRSLRRVRSSHPPAQAATRPNRSLHITLITEGTYPFYVGGVSTWCDQLIRGLEEHQFQIHAIVGNGDEPSVWDRPANLVKITRTALWGNSGPCRRVRKPKRDLEFAGIHQGLIEALMSPQDSAEAFLGLLKRLFHYAQSNNLSAALLSNTALERFSGIWTDWQLALDFKHGRRSGANFDPTAPNPALPTLEDVLVVSDLLSHFLRPLSDAPLRTDICHAVTNGLAPLTAMASKWAFGTPFVLTEHGIYLRERYLGDLESQHGRSVRMLVLNFYQLISSAAYRMADLITPVADYNQRWQIRNGASEGRIRTVHNGVNDKDFPATQTEPEVPTISWVGRVDPLKDLETLIRAFAVVRAELPQARLRLFGPTPAGNEAYRDRCVALVEELDLNAAVVFEGPIRPVVRAYHSGHLLALTSISEAFPYTVIEAMMAGRTTVCTDVGGIREAVGETGLIVPPRDHDAVARACLELLKNDTLRRQLSFNAQVRALEKFTQGRFLNEYRSVYAGVAGLEPAASTTHPPSPVADLRSLRIA